MKRILIIFSLFYTLTYAHTLIINVFDNEDNTMTIEGAYDTGDSAAGAMIRLESLINGNILFKQRLPVEGELIIKIPNEPYQIVLDGGPGHVIIQDGITPLKGFSKKQKDKVNLQTNKNLSIAQNNTNEWTTPSVFLFILCLILFILAIYFSFRNTNKILKEIRKSN